MTQAGKQCFLKLLRPSELQVLNRIGLHCSFTIVIKIENSNFHFVADTIRFYSHCIFNYPSDFITASKYHAEHDPNLQFIA